MKNITKLIGIEFYLFLLVASCFAQLGIAADKDLSFEDSCKCFPPCLPRSENDCKSRRTVSRSDCPCCKVCAQETGEDCGTPDTPCDSDMGLVCRDGSCQAEFTCKLDDDCPDDRFCLSDTCVDPCSILAPCRRSLKGGVCVTRGHSPLCECPPGTQTSPEGGVCLLVPKPQTDFHSSAKDNKLDTKPSDGSFKAEALKIQKINHNSTTLLLPSSSGGELYYKESQSSADGTQVAVAPGKMEVEVQGLRPSSVYTVKWAGSDGVKAKIEVETKDGCLVKGVSYGTGGRWFEGCDSACACLPGGKPDCRPRCLFRPGAIRDETCSEKPSEPDPECCVEYACHKKDSGFDTVVPWVSLNKTEDVPSSRTEDSSQPKLIVTSRKHNSVTVAWDDFSVRTPDAGYVVEFREVPPASLEADLPWMRKEVLSGRPPQPMTITSLKPNTVYEIRVVIYNRNSEKRTGEATETVTVQTEPGCFYGNTSFPIGEFFQGCEEKCSCSRDGSVRCHERCRIPYFRKGSFANDPLCSEDPADGDDCCVLVACEHGSVQEEYDQCANTVCGPNAECVSLSSLSKIRDTEEALQPGSCRCSKGFIGDPSDLENGCTFDPTAAENKTSCNFKNKSYHPSDIFYDGCSFRCTCNNESEIECQARCKFPASLVGKTEAECFFIAAPDDDCCSVKVCNSSSEATKEREPPSLAFDGCISGNETFAKNDKFFIGCELKCTCIGHGDKVCSPRCPPIQDMENKERLQCETLPDPEDTCCLVTICDTATSEVMKQKSTGDGVGADESSTVTTAVPEILSEDKANNTAEELMVNGRANTSFVEGEEKSVTTPTNEMDAGRSETIDDSTRKTTGHDETHVLNHSPDEMIDIRTESTTHAGEHEDFNGVANDLNFLVSRALDKNFTKTAKNDSMSPEVDIHETVSHRPENGEKEETSSEHAFMLAGRHNTIVDLEKKTRSGEIMVPRHEVKIVQTIPLDSNTLQLKVRVSNSVIHKILSSPNEYVVVSYSADSINWANVTIPIDDISIDNLNELIFMVHLNESEAYQLQAGFDGVLSSVVKVSLPTEEKRPDNVSFSRGEVQSSEMCEHKGRFYKLGEEFYDDCAMFCLCGENSNTHCAPIDCPEQFGAELMDPDCIEWDYDHGFVPKPPRCCGELKCQKRRQDVMCSFGGHNFSNFDYIPPEMVPCDEECICEFGNITCNPICPPVQATPPFSLPCHPAEVVLVTGEGYPCCPEWRCRDQVQGEHFPIPPGTLHPAIHTDLGHTAGIPQPNILDVKEDTVYFSFKIPQHLVGLPGGIYLRYTSDLMMNPNPLEWESEVIHAAGNILEEGSWEYMKRGLMPGTTYTMQVALASELSKPEIVSPIFTVTTQRQATTPLPRLELDAQLEAREVTNTSAQISWRRFTDSELQYIDGTQVKYWQETKPIPRAGPMLHRDTNQMLLSELRPGTVYTVDLSFIPHHGFQTVITNTKNITFKTLPKPKDKYAFNITIEGTVVDNNVVITYSGVSEPEELYVSVYRVVYTSDLDKTDSQKFKIPKSQEEKVIDLKGLKPHVEYDIWLEAILTNGGKKKSNVIRVMTDAGELPKPEASETDKMVRKAGYDYYSELVGVSIFAAILCLMLLALLVLYKRKQNRARADINSTSGAYDNPSYKSADNSYAMELNGMKSSSNGSSRSEEP